jgi:alcohol dehydrogenase class IV
MIAPFNFDAPIPLAFGVGRMAKLGRDVSRMAGDGASVVLVSDPFLLTNGLAQQAEAALQSEGHKVHTFSDIRSDPLASSIDALVAKARAVDAACVVALGGGSTMDAAKLAAALAINGDPAEAYALGVQPVPKKGLPKIAIPTTSGTGSEVTRTSVFSTEDRKLWAWGNQLRFNLALLDPSLTTGMPAGLTAATGIDAAVHAIESATNKRRNPVSAAIALGSVRTLRRWLKTAVEEPENLEARGHVQIAACTAGIAFDVTGVAIAHAIGHAMGELAGVHHGRAVGLALNATMQDSAAAAPDAYAEVAQALGVNTDGMTDKDAATQAAPAFTAWLHDVALRLSLDDHGLTTVDAQRIAQLCFEPENRVMVESDSFDYTPETLERATSRMLTAA